MLKAIVLLTITALALGQTVSFCDKYSTALKVTNLELVTIVVNETFYELINGSATPDLRVFFDGSGPGGKTNFIGTQKGAELAGNLITFFGAGLGCTDGTIGNYTGDPDMKAVHLNMPITNAIFVAFNSRLAQVLINNGVKDQTDLAAAGALLESFRSTICNQPDCNMMTTAGVAMTTAGGSYGMIVAPFVSLIAVIAAMAL